jgi:hypothetical protein
MSAQGHSRRFGDVRVTSALPLKADLHRQGQHVRNVPAAEIHTPTTELRTEILWKDFPAARHTVSGFAQPAIMIEIHCVAVIPA